MKRFLDEELKMASAANYDDDEDEFEEGDDLDDEEDDDLEDDDSGDYEDEDDYDLQAPTDVIGIQPGNRKALEKLKRIPTQIKP